MEWASICGANVWLVGHVFWVMWEASWCLCRVSNGVKASTAAEVQGMGRDDVGELEEGWA